MAKIGYARVSTQDQNLDLQIDALEKEGCEKIYSDKVSGVKTQKPEFEKLLDYARPGDTIVVYKLDRLGRSVKGLIELAETLKDKSINLKSLSESIDTTTSMGTLFFHLIAAFAENERNIIVERTNAGLTAARARGRTGGRPKGLSERYRLIASEVKATYDKGEKTMVEIRKIFNIKSQETLYKILAYAKVEVKGFSKKRK